MILVNLNRVNIFGSYAYDVFVLLPDPFLGMRAWRETKVSKDRLGREVENKSC